MNRWIAGSIGFLALAFIVILLYKTKSNKPLYGRYEVDLVRVIEGHEFDVILENGKRVHVFLGVRTPPEVKKEVIRFLNDCLDSNYSCHLVIRGSVADLVMVKEGECFSLTSWLKRQGYVWDQEFEPK